ncbi:MAG: HPr(Ser) kinase/phosphatase [Bacteroidota bacterium]
MRSPEPFKKESISVAFLVEQLRELLRVDVEAVNEVDASERVVVESSLNRPGLALAGYTDLFTHERVQVLGNTECQYLAHLGADARRAAFGRLVQFGIPCLFMTESNGLPADLVEMATDAGIPAYSTPVPSTEFMHHLRDFLEDQFALQQTVHSSLVDVYGIGLLLVGKSGIGKSEVALDLVERGHRLVADDVVVVTKKSEGVLMGSGTELTQHFMEIRGLGIVDVRAMFGIRAIRFQKRVEVVVAMEVWDPDQEYTRIGMVDASREILGVPLPLVRLPIVPGKNMTVICEVIAMNHLLQHYGYDPAQVFARRLADRIRSKEAGDPEGSPARPRRNTEWFEHDTE